MTRIVRYQPREDSMTVSSNLAELIDEGSPVFVGSVSLTLDRAGKNVYAQEHHAVRGSVFVGEESTIPLLARYVPANHELLKAAAGLFTELVPFLGIAGCLTRDDGAVIDLNFFLPSQDPQVLGSKIQHPIRLGHVRDVYITFADYALFISFHRPVSDEQAEKDRIAHRRTDPAIDTLDAALFDPDAFKVTVEEPGKHPSPCIFHPKQNVTIGTCQAVSVPLATDVMLVTHQRGYRELQLLESWSCSLKAPMDSVPLDLDELRRQDRTSMRGGGIVSIPFPLGSIATISVGDQVIQINPLSVEHVHV
jgi:hypothetical protein